MCIKVQYGCIFHPPKHNRALCNSLKNLKTLEGPYSGPRSWSRHQIILCCIVTTMIHIQLFTYTCVSKINNNDEWTNFFRKIYLSHFIRKGCERVMRERWVGDLTDGTYWPKIPLSLAALISRFAGLLNQGSWRPIGLCWVLVLSTASYLQLTEPVCGTGLYNCLKPICILWASHQHPIQPIHSQGYTLISLTGCTCYLHRFISYLTAQAEGQYVTYISYSKLAEGIIEEQIESGEFLLLSHRKWIWSVKLMKFYLFEANFILSHFEQLCHLLINMGNDQSTRRIKD